MSLKPAVIGRKGNANTRQGLDPVMGRLKEA